MGRTLKWAAVAVAVMIWGVLLAIDSPLTRASINTSPLVREFVLGALLAGCGWVLSDATSERGMGRFSWFSMQIGRVAKYFGLVIVIRALAKHFGLLRESSLGVIFAVLGLAILVLAVRGHFQPRSGTPYLPNHIR